VTARPPRVVLVDDHDGYRSALAEVLERSGRVAVVGEVATAEEALTLVEDTAIDLVVCDLHLPGTGGAELCRRLVARGGPPACVISADSRRSAVVEALGAGAVGFVHKSSDSDELVELVEAAARGEAAVDRGTAGALVGPAAGDEPAVALSTRQIVLLRGWADGLGVPALCERTGLDEVRVRELAERTLTDLGAASEAAAVAWALRNRVIQ
jgi:DNA-binding NarL/FixJ family response regulator